MNGARFATPWVLAACLGLLAVRAAGAAEPGLAYPPDSPLAVRHGSVLLYNLVASSAADPEAEDTRLALTNRSATAPAAVRLFVVDGGDGSAGSAFVCLAPGQTASVRASVLRPGVTGFAVAIAVDPGTGCPVVFNELAGQAQVRLASGFQAALPALGVAALGPVPACGAQAAVTFDGVDYNRLPRVLHLSGLASGADERTLLVVNRIGGDLDGASLALGGLTGTLHDDAGQAFGYGADTGGLRQFRSELGDAFPDTAPPFGAVVPAGRSGWMRIMGSADVGLTGAALLLRPAPEAPLVSTRFAGARKAPGPAVDVPGAVNLRTSTLSATNESYTFTVAPPGC